jgi:ribosome-binding factor A
MVSVTGVNMSPDLGIAKIYISIYNAMNKQEVLIQLQENMHRLKNHLYQRIRKKVRRVPDLNLHIDDTLDEMEHLNQLFDKIKGKS